MPTIQQMLKLRQPLSAERENFQPLQLVPALLCLVAIAFAKLLVFLLSQEGESIKLPMNAADSGR